MFWQILLAPLLVPYVLICYIYGYVIGFRLAGSVPDDAL